MSRLQLLVLISSILCLGSSFAHRHVGNYIEADYQSILGEFKYRSEILSYNADDKFYQIRETIINPDGTESVYYRSEYEQYIEGDFTRTADWVENCEQKGGTTEFFELEGEKIQTCRIEESEKTLWRAKVPVGLYFKSDKKLAVFTITKMGWGPQARD